MGIGLWWGVGSRLVGGMGAVLPSRSHFYLWHWSIRDQGGKAKSSIGFQTSDRACVINRTKGYVPAQGHVLELY